ncbi:MAG: hypothetical protein US68_C0008G0052 [Candidatus Shapirobacteria bacterium GW2011_GWE1_38_10]|uniref:Uncharacterized protein n=1 Tax=Candidatus Shapirobacteria bacterium GW2011_GWE1_38_10 TaxID=1618488 RepID=A0A0G0I6K7_9BACT|nr:MAG: hypothetical protein US68_C0008G0052 [Candidatus Shapirobacteria bacterium GW2011_GWE1_38_10]
MATPKTSKKTTNAYVYALGRRKSAVASVKLFKGKGDSTINTRPSSFLSKPLRLKINFISPPKSLVVVEPAN